MEKDCVLTKISFKDVELRKIVARRYPLKDKSVRIPTNLHIAIDVTVDKKKKISYVYLVKDIIYTYSEANNTKEVMVLMQRILSASSRKEYNDKNTKDALEKLFKIKDFSGKDIAEIEMLFKTLSAENQLYIRNKYPSKMNKVDAMINYIRMLR